MTKFEELEAAWWDTYWAARGVYASGDAASANAWDAVRKDYVTELRKTNERTS
jgi:hypothetical protein